MSVGCSPSHTLRLAEIQAGVGFATANEFSSYQLNLLRTHCVGFVLANQEGCIPRSYTRIAVSSIGLASVLLAHAGRLTVAAVTNARGTTSTAELQHHLE